MSIGDLENQMRANLSEPDDLQTGIDAAAPPLAGAETPPAATDDPRDKEIWLFPFSWTDKRGKRWEGNFANKILETHEEQKVAILRARMAGGVPYEALDPTMAQVNLAIAHMTYSLQRTPKWPEAMASGKWDLRKLNNMALIMALWEKVSSHDARYFRYDEIAAEGESDGQ